MPEKIRNFSDILKSEQTSQKKQKGGKHTQAQNLTSLEMKMENKESHIQYLEIEEGVFEKWRRLGTAEGLDNDTAIATFLLQCYKNHPQEPKSDVVCISCRAVLPLVCKACIRNQQQYEQNLQHQPQQSTDLDSLQGSKGGKKERRQRAKSSSARGRRKHGSRSKSKSDTWKAADSVDVRTIKQAEESSVNSQRNIGLSLGSNSDEDGDTGEAEPCFDPTQRNEEDVSDWSLPKTKAKKDPAAAKASKKKEEPEHPFLCQLCGASFGKARGLKRHQIVHTGEKPHVCNICPAAFANKSVLITHIRKHTGEKPFLCPHCGAAFAQRYNLTTHLRTHSGERPHKCDRCWRSFTTSSALTRHVRIHTGEKPYVCVQCGAAFPQSGNLREHMRKHTGIKDFQCQLCGTKFATSTRLKRHQKLVKCADRQRARFVLTLAGDTPVDLS